MNKTEEFLASFVCALMADRYAAIQVVNSLTDNREELDIIRTRMALSPKIGKVLFEIEKSFNWRTNEFQVFGPVMGEFRDAIFDFMLLFAWYEAKSTLESMRKLDEDVFKHPTNMTRIELQVKEFNKLRNKLRRQFDSIHSRVQDTGRYTAWIAARHREGLSEDISDEERRTGVPTLGVV